MVTQKTQIKNSNNLSKCQKCHWYYFISKAPFHCNYCLLQGNKSAFKELNINDINHEKWHDFDKKIKKVMF